MPANKIRGSVSLDDEPSTPAAERRGGRQTVVAGYRAMATFSPRALPARMVPHEEEAMSETIDLKQTVEGNDGISVIRGGGIVRGWNGIQYRAGLSAKNVNAHKLSMNVATIPPGGVAYAHIHVGFEVMLYILQGRVRHEYGPGLKKAVENEAGDFIFIEPGVPHEVFNLSDTEPVVAVVARSDASEWENIVTYDRNSES
jgi:uncharacterized RmlC-like cupin family protein